MKFLRLALGAPLCVHAAGYQRNAIKWAKRALDNGAGDMSAKRARYLDPIPAVARESEGESEAEEATESEGMSDAAEAMNSDWDESSTDVVGAEAARRAAKPLRFGDIPAGSSFWFPSALLRLHEVVVGGSFKKLVDEYDARRQDARQSQDAPQLRRLPVWDAKDRARIKNRRGEVEDVDNGVADGLLFDLSRRRGEHQAELARVVADLPLALADSVASVTGSGGSDRCRAMAEDALQILVEAFPDPQDRDRAARENKALVTVSASPSCARELERARAELAAHDVTMEVGGLALQEDAAAGSASTGEQTSEDINTLHRIFLTEETGTSRLPGQGGPEGRDRRMQRVAAREDAGIRTFRFVWVRPIPDPAGAVIPDHVQGTSPRTSSAGFSRVGGCSSSSSSSSTRTSIFSPSPVQEVSRRNKHYLAFQVWVALRPSTGEVRLEDFNVHAVTEEICTDLTGVGGSWTGERSGIELLSVAFWNPLEPPQTLWRPLSETIRNMV